MWRQSRKPQMSENIATNHTNETTMLGPLMCEDSGVDNGEPVGGPSWPPSSASACSRRVATTGDGPPLGISDNQMPSNEEKRE